MASPESVPLQEKKPVASTAGPCKVRPSAASKAFTRFPCISLCYAFELLTLEMPLTNIAFDEFHTISRDMNSFFVNFVTITNLFFLSPLTFFFQPCLCVFLFLILFCKCYQQRYFWSYFNADVNQFPHVVLVQSSRLGFCHS